MSVFASRKQPSTAAKEPAAPTTVKRVISELQANLHFGKKCERTPICLDKSDETSGETTGREPSRLLRTSAERKMLPDSDSSFPLEKQRRAVTTVSVSTCPSCGSENVSCTPSSGPRRSSSFQQLVPPRPTGCTGCIRPAPPPPVYRSQSFSFKCPEYYEPEKKLDMLDCNANGCTACAKQHKAKKLYQQHRVRRDPLKKPKKRPRNSGVSRSFGGVDAAHRFRSVEQLHRCDNDWCSRNKYSSHHQLSPCRPPRWSAKAYEAARKESMEPLPRTPDYRFWDVEEWRAQMKRDKAREKERAVLMVVSAIGIIVFICVSYFGTLLFLRVTKLP